MTERTRTELLAWLGVWRNKMPVEGVAALQNWIDAQGSLCTPEVPDRVERREDMSPDGRLVLLREQDGDMIVAIQQYYDSCTTRKLERPIFAQVQFCTYSGGGKSQRVREALVALMQAMHEENLVNPQSAHPKGGIMPERPRVVCLCGSTKFMDAFQAANLSETLAGRIVLSIGCNTKSEADLQRLGELTGEKKRQRDDLHKRKIDLADEILVLNVGCYIGPSTRSEIEYAKAHGKAIRYLEIIDAKGI